MSPRPRTVDDATVLAAAGRAISRVGPARLTLADVAAEAGLAPATLVQRFGSKRGLLLAFSEQGVTTVAGHFAAARDATASPLAAAVEGLVRLAGEVAEPAAHAHHLALLALDLADPDARRFAAAHAQAVRAELRVLLKGAIQLGELPSGDTEALAHALHVTYNGSLIAWAIEPVGGLAERLRRDLEARLPHS